MKLPFAIDDVKKLDAHFFVSEVLTKVKDKFAAEDTGEGAVTFNVDGAGSWTWDLASLEVREGAADAGDLDLKGSSADFEAALSGKLDLATAGDKFQLAFSGASEELNGLAHMFRLATVNEAALKSSGAFKGGTGEPPKQLRAKSGALMKYNPPPVKKDKFESADNDNALADLPAPSDQVGFAAFNFASLLDALAKKAD